MIEKPIYRPSELKAFLTSLGISPKKRLSQNFLIDGNILRKITKHASVTSEDLILEIGPGPGALTEQLLAHGAEVIAIEKDPKLAQALKRLSNNFPLTIIQEDVLKCDIKDLIKKKLKKGQKCKVIANLPYHLTSPILERLLPLHSLILSLTVMVQEEVGRRLTAQPGNKDYSSLTLFTRFYSDPSYAFIVSPNCFYPIPKVNSSIVQLRLKPPPKECNVKKFFQMSRAIFGQRRKMVRTSLCTLYDRTTVEEALKTSDIPLTARPETVSLEQFLKLHKALSR